MKNGSYYGIDFGTTNTSVFLYHYDAEYGSRETGFGTDGKDLVPFSSCIALPQQEGGKPLFGREVRDHINELADSYKIVTSFKSYLGTEQEIPAGNYRYNGRQLAAMFLNHVRTVIDRPDFTEAIFSIPVGFTPEARTELLQAAEEAGIHVKGFITESTAAYISKMNDIKACSKVFVIDWGGGTLDLSIINLKEGKIYEDAVYGTKFGGDDVDHEFALRIHPMVYPDTAYDELEPSKKDRLLRNVEEMKIHFSDSFEDYEMILGPGSRPVTIDYDTFEEIVSPLVTEHVMLAMDKIMKQANVNADGIDAVVLAGGSSGIRPFWELLTGIFGEDKLVTDKAYQWMVARGASITSAAGCEFRLNDDICILLSDDSTYPILRRDQNKVGDKSAVLTFSMTDDASDAHFIFTDSSGEHKYKMQSMPTKGYFGEQLFLSAEIGNDQIARIKIENPSIDTEQSVRMCELNMLRFYYDLNGIKE